MAIEVRIPTILRTYTGGEKIVQGEGGTLEARRKECVVSRQKGVSNV